ncbi:MAG: redoxin domain-containing protein [Planctomycetes bacterium]|nr:redoxin domain-containing protein [Planctomycetota bacterium]
MRKRLVIAALACAILAPAHADPKAGAIGESMGDFRAKDQAGTEHSLSDCKDAKAVVLVFVGTQCPVSGRYLPELGEIASDYASKGVTLWGVNSNRNEQGELAAFSKSHGIAFPVLADGDQTIADLLHVDTVPSAVVLDSKRAVHYRGRIDDDPMGGRPRKHELRDAIDAVLAGRDIEEPETAPRGCCVHRGDPPKDGPVTWAKDVAPIIQQNCVKCHRPNQVGPFDLTDYAQASDFAREIRTAVSSRAMPPWKPTGGVEFLNDRHLSQAQIDTIVKWADAGAPPGDLAQEPPLPEFAEGWTNGTPDLVLETDEFELSAKGPTDQYMHFVCHTNLPADQWISSTEIRPGNPRIIHHVQAFVDLSGRARMLDEQAKGPGYPTDGSAPGFMPASDLGIWAPGDTPFTLPDGVGRKLAKGADVVLQVHYNRCGTAQKDRTRIGLYFSKKPVRQPFLWTAAVNTKIEIPAGAENHVVTAAWEATQASTIYVVFPHQHRLGKSSQLVAELPDGTRKTIIEIANWEFKWQDEYLLKTPMHLPAGTIVRFTAVYDNSDKNPQNPNRPPQRVYWGERTSDEMCLAFIGYVADEEDPATQK